MNRRAPVRSVLAERRMFSNGGMLPISTPFQNTPSGILASSSPLIDSVSQEILAPLTGGPMPMAEGGVAKFEHGGVHGIPTREEWYKMLNQPPPGVTVSEKVIEKVPALPGGQITYQDKVNFGNELRKAMKLRDEALQALQPSGTSEFGRGVSEFGRDIVENVETLFRTGPEVSAAQIKRDAARAEAKAERLKEVGFDSEEAQQAEISRISNLPPSFWLGKSGADERTIDYWNQAGLPSDYQKRFPTVSTDEVVSAEGPVRTDIQEFLEGEDVISSEGLPYEGDSDAIEAVVPAAEPVVPAAEPVVPAAEPAAKVTDTDRPLDDTQLFLEQGLITDFKGKAPSEEEESAAKAEKKAVSDQTLLEIANAAENQNVDRDMSFFKKRFIDEVGEYEGKTEYEKGLDFLKLGMSIAAGASDNAVENISRGVYATIDEFGVDEEQKRDFNRKVKFSAVQYALSNVAREEAQGEADKRKLYFFYDQDTKTKAKPYGDLVAHSLADILDNDGKLPPNLREKDLVIKEISAVAALNKSLNEQLIDNAELWRIGRVEADNIRERLDNNETTFVSGEVAIGLLNSVLGDVAGGNITGIGNAGKELWRRAIVAAGGDPGDKFKNIEDARAKIRRAFQLLIPESLGQAQTANSISNRDVQFLADAYIDSGFLENGVFSFTTTGIDALGERLMGAMEVFKNAQFKALADYDDIIKRLNDSEEALTKSQKTGIPVDPGPFGPKYFSSALERIKPVAEKTRGIISGTQATPRLWSYEFDEDERKFRYKGAKGTVFEGQFFTPNEVNIKKLYGR